MTSSPRGTARAPPGRKSFWMSTRIRVRICCTMLLVPLRFSREQPRRIDRQPGCCPTRHARGSGDDHACGVTFPGAALMAGMSRRKRIGSALLGAAFLLTTATSTAFAAEKTEAQGSAAQQAPPKKHSKLKGAVIGGAGGAVVGGKKGAALGAAGGALYQHHKNKKEAKQQQKAQQ